MSTRKRKKTQSQQSNFIFKEVTPKTQNQAKLKEAINRNLLTFAIGAAGCGKTHIAVGLAVEHFYAQYIDKIIITRPIVEVGQSMGFLPGSFEEKIHPYLMPIYDELDLFVNPNSNNPPQVEILPLNFMRGRTLKNSFVILDEAQNATEEQLTMFLTRFGEGCKMVVTGDITQSDLPQRFQGALESISGKLKGEDLIEVVELGPQDIVRHELVGRILARL